MLGNWNQIKCFKRNITFIATRKKEIIAIFWRMRVKYAFITIYSGLHYLLKLRLKIILLNKYKILQKANLKCIDFVYLQIYSFFFG